METTQLIENVTVVGPDGLTEGMDVIIEGSRIADIRPSRAAAESGGVYLLPGFIDIHSDNIETVIQPRPTSVMDMEIALMEQEKCLVNNGITTMFHSLSLMSEASPAVREKEVRKPANMIALSRLIAGYKERDRLIRHRFHCRYDLRNIEGHAIVQKYLTEGLVDLMSFIDHTPGQGQYRDLTKYRETLRKYNPQLNEAGIEDLLSKRMGTPAVSREKIRELTDLAMTKNVPVASHDDDKEEKLDYMHGELNVRISEFPVELGIARMAKARGMHTVAGAPNVLLGKSHSGNVSATKAIIDGSIDILCSDYFPPAMPHAVLNLNEELALPLSEAVNLVSLNPARALGIDSRFGSIEIRKTADLILVSRQNGKPAINKVFIDGQLVSALSYRRNGAR